MKIASWNVNSLNVRLPHLEQWLADFAPDVVGIQETKLEDHKFPDTRLLELGYRNVFRVLIMAFIDAEGFDLRSVKKSCVHIAQPDGRIIPFDTFNLFYRDDRAQQLEKLRRMVEAGQRLETEGEPAA